MFDVARQVGELLRDVIRTASPTGERADSTFDATIMLGGQIRGGGARLFLIYPEGNFLEASADTPFFQIGETKYGRPIILRAFEPTMSYEQAIKLLLVLMPSVKPWPVSVSCAEWWLLTPTAACQMMARCSMTGVAISS